jgi:hypothetical protein
MWRWNPPLVYTQPSEKDALQTYDVAGTQRDLEPNIGFASPPTFSYNGPFEGAIHPEDYRVAEGRRLNCRPVGCYGRSKPANMVFILA